MEGMKRLIQETTGYTVFLANQKWSKLDISGRKAKVQRMHVKIYLEETGIGCGIIIKKPIKH